jgi:hypothetical protein
LDRTESIVSKTKTAGHFSLLSEWRDYIVGPSSEKPAVQKRTHVGHSIATIMYGVQTQEKEKLGEKVSPGFFGFDAGVSTKP